MIDFTLNLDKEATFIKKKISNRMFVLNFYLVIICFFWFQKFI